MSRPLVNQPLAVRQDSGYHEIGADEQNMDILSEVSKKKNGNEEGFAGSYEAMTLEDNRNRGQKNGIPKPGKGEWEVAGYAKTPSQMGEGGVHFSDHGEMKRLQAFGATDGSILHERCTDSIACFGRRDFMSSTSRNLSPDVWNTDQEPLLRVHGKSPIENEFGQNRYKKHIPISSSTQGYVWNPETQNCQKVGNYSVNLHAKGEVDESTDSLQRDVADVKADLARIWKILMAVISFLVVLTFVVLLIGCWVLIYPMNCRDSKVATTEDVGGLSVSDGDLLLANSQENPGKKHGAPSSLQGETQVKHLIDMTEPSQLHWKRMSASQPHSWQEESLKGTVERSYLEDEKQEDDHAMTSVSHDLRVYGRPSTGNLQSAKDGEDDFFEVEGLYSFNDDEDEDEDEDEDNNDRDDADYKEDESDDFEDEEDGSDDGWENDESHLIDSFEEEEDDDDNDEKKPSSLQTLLSLMNNPHSNGGLENPSARDDHLEIEQDTLFSLVSRKKRSVKNKAKRESPKPVCDCKKTKRQMKRLQRCCRRGKSSKIKYDVYEGNFYDLFDMERDFLKENCMQVKDWPGKPAVCRDTYLKIKEPDTALGCFQPKKKVHLTEFNNGTGVFKVKNHGLYLIQARLTIDDETNHHWAAVVVNTNAELACPPGGFKRALDRKETHKLRTCQMSGMLQLKKGDKVMLKIMSEGIEIALGEAHMPTFTIIRIGGH